LFNICLTTADKTYGCSYRVIKIIRLFIGVTFNLSCPMQNTLIPLRLLLETSEINSEILRNIIRQGIDIEKLTYQAKVELDDLDFLESQNKIMQSEKFLALLCCL
jgi:hypothetical protein